MGIHSSRHCVPYGNVSSSVTLWLPLTASHKAYNLYPPGNKDIADLGKGLTGHSKSDIALIFNVNWPPCTCYSDLHSHLFRMNKISLMITYAQHDIFVSMAKTLAKDKIERLFTGRRHIAQGLHMLHSQEGEP